MAECGARALRFFTMGLLRFRSDFGAGDCSLHGSTIGGFTGAAQQPVDRDAEHLSEGDHRFATRPLSLARLDQGDDGLGFACQFSEMSGGHARQLTGGRDAL